MNIRIIGAIFIMVSCGGFGFLMAANHKKETRTLRNLVNALEFMECELSYRLTPLPELCRSTAAGTTGVLKEVFNHLAEELENQITPNAEECMIAAIKRVRDVPLLTKHILDSFAGTLGCFDVDGQVKCIRNVRNEAHDALQRCCADQNTRLRNYQTLGLCAGAAIVILII